MTWIRTKWSETTQGDPGISHDSEVKGGIIINADQGESETKKSKASFTLIVECDAL